MSIFRISGRTLAVLSAASFLAAIPAGRAAAQEPATPAKGDWAVSAGVGAQYKPDYEGSDDYTIDPVPMLSITYRDIVFLRGATLGANALTIKGPGPNDRLRIGPLVRYRGGRDQDDNDALRGLGNVDTSVEVGGFVRYSVARWSLGLTAAQDVAGGHEGMLVEASGGYAMPLAKDLHANFGVSTTWASDDYMRSFFGISAAQAARSGRAQYDAGAGIKDVGLSLGIEYDLTEHWGIGGSLGYKRLLGDAADSPIVAQDGSSNQFSTGLLLKYRF